MSHPKLEYATVLLNPETRVTFVDIKSKTDVKHSRVLSRLRRNAKNVLIGLLLVFTVLSFLNQLSLRYEEKRIDDKIRTLIKKQNEYLEIVKQLEKPQKDASRSRSTRTARSTGTPHFYLEGLERDIDVTDGHGVFRWKNSGLSTQNFYADTTQGYLTEVHIRKPGVYFVFAKVTANGRQRVPSNTLPPVGIVLMKNNQEILDEAWLTQDERGRHYGSLRGVGYNVENSYPLNTITLFGMHSLDINDKIYIQKPPDRIFNNNDRFLNGNDKLRFGAILIEERL